MMNTLTLFALAAVVGAIMGAAVFGVYVAFDIKRQTRRDFDRYN